MTLKKYVAALRIYLDRGGRLRSNHLTLGGRVMSAKTLSPTL
jgi:hypothetical protein